MSFIMSSGYTALNSVFFFGYLANFAAEVARIDSVNFYCRKPAGSIALFTNARGSLGSEILSGLDSPIFMSALTEYGSGLSSPSPATDLIDAAPAV